MSLEARGFGSQIVRPFRCHLVQRHAAVSLSRIKASLVDGPDVALIANVLTAWVLGACIVLARDVLAA